MVLLPWKELREIKDENFCFYSLRKIKSLQFYLKNFQEKGLFSLNGSFDYSTIGELAFRKVINDHTSFHQISSEMDTRPVPPPSRKWRSEGVSNDNVHRNPSSSSKRHNNPSFISSSFSPKEDLTSYSPDESLKKSAKRDAINFTTFKESENFHSNL